VGINQNTQLLTVTLTCQVRLESAPESEQCDSFDVLSLFHHKLREKGGI
jgi:hypothetical protein